MISLARILDGLKSLHLVFPHFNEGFKVFKTRLKLSWINKGQLFCVTYLKMKGRKGAQRHLGSINKSFISPWKQNFYSFYSSKPFLYIIIIIRIWIWTQWCYIPCTVLCNPSTVYFSKSILCKDSMHNVNWPNAKNFFLKH